MQPFDELRGVVRRRAIVGCAEDQHAALLRQLAGIVVQRRELARKAIDLRQIGDARRQFLGGTEIGAVEHQQRRIVAGPRRGAGRGRAGTCRCRRGAGIGAALAIGARADLDLEAFRLDRQRFLQMHLVALMVDQLETLENHA